MHKKYNGDIQKFQDEFISIKYTLENYDYFDLLGGAIFVDDTLVAYTIGEKLTEDTALVHIEKADINYNGSYAIINNEFSISNGFNNCLQINCSTKLSGNSNNSSSIRLVFVVLLNIILTTRIC